MEGAEELAQGLVREVAAPAEFREAEARALAELVLAEVRQAKLAVCGKVPVDLAAGAGWEPVVPQVAEQEAVRAVQGLEEAVVPALAPEGVVARAAEAVLAALAPAVPVPAGVGALVPSAVAVPARAAEAALVVPVEAAQAELAREVAALAARVPVMAGEAWALAAEVVARAAELRAEEEKQRRRGNG